MTSRQQDSCYIVCVPFCTATVITDRRRTEAKTNPLPWSIYCVFQNTHAQEHLHTHAQTHTGIHTLLCFALIHNGMTLTFPLSYFAHTHRQNNANKSSVSLRPSRHHALSFFSKHRLNVDSGILWFGPLCLLHVLKMNAERPALLPHVLSSANSSKCWELFIKVTMINNDWCCNYRPIAAPFDVEF